MKNSNEKNKSTNLYNSKEIINNNQEISRGIFPDEIEEINIKELFIALFRRKKIILFTSGTFFLFTAILTSYERVFNPSFRGSFSLLIKDPIAINQTNSSLLSSNNAPQPLRNLFESKKSGSINNLVAFLKSSIVLGDIAAKNNLSVGALSSKISINLLDINKEKADGVLNIDLITNDPQKGLLLLNDLKDLYLKTSINQKQIKLQEGLDFINSQYPSIENKNRLLKKELVDFQERYSFIDPLSQAKDLKSRQRVIESQILLNKSGLERLMKVRKDLLAGKISAIEFKSTLSSGPNDIFALLDVDQGLLKEQIELEKEIANNRTIFKPESNVIKSLLARQEKLNPIFLKSQLQSIEMVIDETKTKIQIDESKRDDIENKFLLLPSLINKYQSIIDNIKLSEANLEGIKTAQEKFKLDLAEKNVQWKVLSAPSMNSVPFKPNIIFNIAFSLFVGTITGSILALLRDRIDNKFYSSISVRDYLKENLLGHIPYLSFYKDLDKNINNDTLNSLTNETTYQDKLIINKDPFKDIFAALLSLKNFSGIKSLSILSTDYSEFASSLNIGLANSLSTMDKNVLLVDLDFRSNEINNKLGMNNSKGLSDLIESKNISIKELINKSESSDFSILGSGSNISDPVKLLSSNIISNIIIELNTLDEFDYIIYNITPLANASDLFVYSDNIDGFIYNVSLANIDRNQAKDNYIKACISSLNILGIITNEVEFSLIKTNDKSFNRFENVKDFINSIISKSKNKSLIKVSKALLAFVGLSERWTNSLINLIK